MSLLGHFSRRLVGSIGAIFGASIVSFLLMRLLPGNPARIIVGPYASAATLHGETVALGLTKPVYVQYWDFVSDFVQGRWGFSYSIGEPVRTEIGARLPASIELGLFAFLFAFVGAVTCALLSTYRRRRAADALVQGTAFIGLGTPPFWIGLLLLLLLSSTLHILPGPEGRLAAGATPPPDVTGLYTVDAVIAGQWGTFWDAFKHLLLPAFVLGMAPYAFLVRLLRANLLEVSREQFLLVVRSKGVSRWTAFRRHALPNAILPTITAGGLILAQLVSGSVLIEGVFDWPGVGQLVAQAILAKDFAVVQVFILLAASAYVVVNLVVDTLYGVIDPRVRSGRAVGAR
jgi:ABC-type dipeptide/oligopeptide/nickel transport system permease component